MVKRILKDVKIHHLYLLLHSIFKNDNATMTELINDTQLSQPSVRNMIRLLQQNNVVQEIGTDSSTGGRCPARFGLVEQHFTSICLYIQNPKLTYQIYSYKEKISEAVIEFSHEDELKKIIIDLIKHYNCKCASIAVEGIVREDEYLTDHQNCFEHHHWIKELKKDTNILVILENDVKAMQLGAYSQHQKTNAVYLHLNEKGIGSSYMHGGRLVHGNYGIAGEIGLIPYQQISLNQAVRTCKKANDFQSIIAHLLIIILTTFDPEHIDLSLQLDWKLDWSIINKDIYTYLHPNFTYEIKVYQNYLDNLFLGLNYLGIENILKQLAEKNDEKL